MTIEDGEAFSAGMVALAAVTNGGKQLDTVTQRAYWTVLEKVPGAIVIKALRLAMDHFDFFPAASDLLRLCDEVDHQEAERFALTAPEPEPHALLPAGDTYTGTVAFERPQELYHCYECQDRGFRYHFAPPGHKPYDRWVTRCPCSKPDENGYIANPKRRMELDRAQRELHVGKYAPKALTRGRRRYKEN